MDKTIKIHVLGDYGPFSKTGLSFSFLITINSHNLLVDIGAPLFNLLPPNIISSVENVIITHVHDDHKRWFSDLALFKTYVIPSKKLTLIASYEVINMVRLSSSYALENTLSPDSTQAITVPYSFFVKELPATPMPSADIVKVNIRPDTFTYKVINPSTGEELPSDKAKIVLKPDTLTPRLLYLTDDGLWVEPINYFDYSEDFYISPHPEIPFAGAKIKLEKAASWHGLPVNSVLISFDDVRLAISSDTYFNPTVWRQLTERRAVSKPPTPQFIEGDINDYIQVYWSSKRYYKAVRLFEEYITFHDAATLNTVVHTDYPYVRHINAKLLYLTHVPDNFVSEFPITCTGFKYLITSDKAFIVKDDYLININADYYIKQAAECYVAFVSSKPNRLITRTSQGVLKLRKLEDNIPDIEEVVAEVRMYKVINGDLYEIIEDPNETYMLRPDGKVEIVKYDSKGSVGKLAIPVELDRVEKIRFKVGI